MANKNINGVEQTSNYGAVGTLVGTIHSQKTEDQELKNELQPNWLKKLRKSIINYRLQIIGSALAFLSAIFMSTYNAMIQALELDFSEAALIRGRVA